MRKLLNQNLWAVIALFLLVLMLFAGVEWLHVIFEPRESAFTGHDFFDIMLTVILWLIAGFVLLAITGIFMYVWLPRTEMVLGGFKNGRGITLSQEERDGLCTAVHQYLLEEMRRLRHSFSFHKSPRGAAVGELDSFAFAKYPLDLPGDTVKNVDNTVEGQLASFAAALAEPAPDQWKWATALVGLFVRPTRVRITGTLQVLTHPRYGQGITFEIADERGKEAPIIYTIWDDSSPHEHDPWGNDIIGDFNLESFLMRAAQSLARELLKWELIAHPPLRVRLSGHTKRYRAQVYDLFGLMERRLSNAYDDLYYQRAIHNFRQAIDSCESWYAPFADLADTLSMESQAKMAHCQSWEEWLDALALQRIALDEYRHAQLRFKTYPPGSTLDGGIPGSGTDTEQVSQPVGPFRPSMPHVKPDLRNDFNQKVLSISALRASLLAGHIGPQHVKEELEKLGGPPPTSDTADPRLLYYFACAYALAYKHAVSAPTSFPDHATAAANAAALKLQAIEYLAFSLGRIAQKIGYLPFDVTTSGSLVMNTQQVEDEIGITNPAWYYWLRVDMDPDFEVFKPDGLVIRLKQLLEQTLRWKYFKENYCLEQGKANPAEFEALISEVINQTDRQIPAPNQIETRTQELAGLSRWFASSIE